MTDYNYSQLADEEALRPLANGGVTVNRSEHLVRLCGVGIELCFTGPGEFKAHITRAKLPRIWLAGVEEVAPRIARLSFACEQTLAIFATDADPSQFCDAVKLGPWDVMLLHGCNGTVHHRTHGASRWGLIAVDQAAFIAHCQALTGSGAAVPTRRAILRPTWFAAARLRQLHAKICDLAATTPTIISHREAARALENDVLHALVNCLAGDAIGDQPLRIRRHLEIIDAFERVVALRLREPLTVAEISAEIGVPDRTLRACCTEVLGMSPSRYLRLRRLNLVRAALEQSQPAPGTISEVAKRYGFSQLGRFATSYRETFGEAPSATLSRYLPQP